jgi:uncharacterized protein YuzE
MSLKPPVYVRLRNDKVVYTEEVIDDTVLVDYNGKGQPVGVEILLSTSNSVFEPASDVLKVELEFFEQHHKEWFEHHADKIALVHGRKVYGFYDNYENALKAGYDRLGIVPFLLKEVQFKDDVIFL